MRLQKYLAHAGVASRRKAEDFIVAGHVRVNGTVVRELGRVVDESDRVELAGKRVALPARHRYVVSQEREIETCRSGVSPGGGRVVPVGRLDYDTSGVLLLTNDGELAHVLTHPRYGVEKTYRAVVRGRLQGEDVKRFLAGMRLDGSRSSPAKIRVVRAGSASSELDITIHEGRNRQVRRMFDATDHPVLSLVRLRFGPIALGDLRVGTSRDATEKELAELRALRRSVDAEDDDA